MVKCIQASVLLPNIQYFKCDLWCTVYHESFEAEKFHFLRVRETFLYESSRWHCSNVDLRESMRDSTKVFHKGLHVQLATKLFCLKTFLVYGSRFTGDDQW